MIFGWFYLAGMAVERTVLSTSYYKGVLNKAGIAAYAHEILEEGIYNRLPQEMPEDVQVIMVGAFVQAFPQEWFEEHFLMIMDDVLALVKGKQETLTAIIDLRDGKDRYKKELAEKLVGLPADRLEMMELHPEKIEIMVEEMLRDINLPDQLLLSELLEREGLPGEFEEAVSRLQQYRGYFLYIPYLFFVVLLLLCCLLAGWFNGLKWFGTAYLVSGITFCAGLLIIWAVLISPFIAAPGKGIPLDTEILLIAAKYTIARISTVPLVFVILGLLLLTGGTVLERYRGKNIDTDDAVPRNELPGSADPVE
ncbi:MAG: hypothetical protein AB1796_02495 [Bacillota bacterium]